MSEILERASVAAVREPVVIGLPANGVPKVGVLHDDAWS